MKRACTVPGRVNILGEHTDYTGGLALPFAVDREVSVSAEAIDAPELLLTSGSFEGAIRIPLERLSEAAPRDWSRYAVGVAAMLHRVQPFESGLALTIDGNLPPGAGMSSSAAVTLATTLALLAAFGEVTPPDELVAFCKTVERHYAGTNCGDLDYRAILEARAGHAVLLDFATGGSEAISLAGLEDVTFFVADSMVQRNLSDSDYNARARECQEIAQRLRRHGVLAEDQDLGHLTQQQFRQHPPVELTSTMEARLRHIVAENERVRSARGALTNGDSRRLGELLHQSHRSLAIDYAVSCPELDRLVELGRRGGSLGSRMMGGGFGGATLHLVPEGEVRRCREGLERYYYRPSGRTATICGPVASVDGLLARYPEAFSSTPLPAPGGLLQQALRQAGA